MLSSGLNSKRSLKWLAKEAKLRISYKFMKDCLFCKIVKGDIKTDMVLETAKAMAFNDINPVSEVHIVIIPKKHIDTAISITEADGQDLVAMHEAAKKLVEKKKLSRYRLAYNGGKFQHVPHVHMHLLAGKKVEWGKL
jgi:histidine triad (HIT) family protein